MSEIRITGPLLNVLLALADGERHGYGIMQEVVAFTNGEVRLGPGTLYGVLKRMLEAGLVAESEGPPDVDDDERRRYYRLTELGRMRLETELAQTARTMVVARQKKVAFPSAAEGT